MSLQAVSSSDTKKCPYCAEEIKAEAIVCRFCNRDLRAISGPSHASTISRPSQYEDSQSRYASAQVPSSGTRGKSIIKAAATMLILFFFLPWITVSCGSQHVVTMSGYELAAGTQAELLGDSYGTVTHPILFLIPVLSLVVIIVAFVRSNKSSIIEMLLTVGIVGILISKWIELSSKGDEYGIVQIKPEFGLWLTFIAIALMGAGSIMALSPHANEGSSDPSVGPPPNKYRTRCPKCGQDIYGLAEVCSHCGYRLSPIVSTEATRVHSNPVVA